MIAEQLYRDKTETANAAKPRIERISDIPVSRPRLSRRKVHRFIVSDIQPDTPVFQAFLENLEVFSAREAAPIVLSSCGHKPGKHTDANYDIRGRAYLFHDRIQLTPDCLLLGSHPINPTTPTPLRGLHKTNGGGHVVAAHPRLAMESIPRVHEMPPRYMWTTGTVSHPSYQPSAAGMAAIHHHAYGALLVEIDVDGEVFFHQIVADATGSFQVLDVFVTGGQVYPDRRVRAIRYGDIHHAFLDSAIALATWGIDLATGEKVTEDNLLDGLWPEHQIFDDTLDFRTRKYHDLKVTHKRAKTLTETTDNVEDEVKAAASFVNACLREGTKTVLIESNHDNALARWLEGSAGGKDPENAYYWHRLNGKWLGDIREGKTSSIVEWAMRRAGLAREVRFVAEGQSYLIDGIQNGIHGHNGTGGRPGSPKQFNSLGYGVTTDHTHAPGIDGDVYTGGVSARLDQDYVRRGQFRWAHAHVVQYHNRTRALLCLSADGRFRAMGDRQAALLAA